MIIERLHIEGYGIFFDKKIGDLRKGINILFGKNEAGKSTLLDFIRMTLLGYPRRTTDRRPPLMGGAHGGRIWLKTRENEPLQVYRSGKRDLQFIYRKEQSADEQLLGGLMGHATPDLYNNIYAITVDELNDVGLLNQSGVEDKLFSMGMGLPGVDFGTFESGLKEQAEKYFKPGGSRQRLIRLSGDIETRQLRIRELHGKLDHYNRLTEALDALREQQQATEAQRDEKRGLVNKFTNYQKAYEHFIRYRDAVKHLENMGECRVFPVQLLEDYKTLKQKSGHLKEQLDKSLKESSALSGKIDSIQVDPALLAHAHLLDYFRSNVKVYEQALEEQKTLAQKEKDAKAETAAILKQLGEEYEKETLLKTAGTIHLQHSGNKAGEEQVKIGSAIGRAEDLIRQLTQKQDAAGQKLQHIRKEMAALSVPDDEKLEAALKHQAALDIEFQKALSPGKGTPERTGRIIRLAGFILTLALAGAGALQDRFAFKVVFITTAVLGFLVLLVLSRGRKAGASEPVDANALNQELKKLEKDIEAYQALKKDEKALSADLEVLELDLDKEEERLKELKQELHESNKHWQEVLARIGLPGGYPPQHIGDLIREIDKLEAAENRRQEALRKMKSHRETVRKFEENLFAVAPPAAGLPDNPRYPGGQADTASAGPDPGKAQEAHTLIGKLQENEEKRTRRESLLEQLDKERANGEILKNDLSRTGDRMQEVLDEVKAENETALYRHFENQQRITELNRQRQEAEAHIKTLCGHDQFKRNVAFLSDQDPGELSAALRTHQENYDRADARYSELNREIGSKEQELKSLLEPDEMFDLQNQVEALKTRLREDTREWLAAKMALSILGESKQRFEEEKQPAVIRASREYFKNITGAEYVGLKVSLSEKHISLQDHAGRTKTVGELSRGTKEQLLLAVRMGLIAEYEKNTEPLPVVLDDVMVNFDPERAGNTARVLSEFARDRQVILFTCHPASMDLFREFEPNVLAW